MSKYKAVIELELEKPEDYLQEMSLKSAVDNANAAADDAEKIPAVADAEVEMVGRIAEPEDDDE